MYMHLLLVVYINQYRLKILLLAMVNEKNTSNANLNSIKQIPYYMTYNYPTQA